MPAPAPPAARDVVDDAVARSLSAWRDGSAPIGARPPRIAVALSGGCDSMLLLDALARLAPHLGLAASAVHVHHGLSPHADAWAALCADVCAAHSLPLVVTRVAVETRAGRSLEACARAARYAAFAALDVDAVALAHHADDQAETLLLQLLRGAGPHGLAAMPALRAAPRGPSFVRPLLALPRAVLRGLARGRGLVWAEDESNADLRLRRNYLRAEVTPRLARAFPGYPQTLLRAAAHQADAARLADELAEEDARGALAADPVDGPTLARGRLVELARERAHRARNLLRWFLRRHGLTAPSAARLEAMLAQLVGAARDARVRLVHEHRVLGVHRERIVAYAPVECWPEAHWRGEAAIGLPHGSVSFVAAEGRGLAAERIAPGTLTVRSRSGGERLRPAPGRARQLLTHLFQERGVPAWRRDAWPLLYVGEDLVAVPGVGIDPTFAAAPRQPGVEVSWLPRPWQSLILVNPGDEVRG